MKLKKNHEPEKETKVNEAADDVMEELDGDLLNQVSGAGSPFAIPRAENQSIDSDLRNNG
jgi:hypothetical protein